MVTGRRLHAFRGGVVGICLLFLLLIIGVGSAAGVGYVTITWNDNNNALSTRPSSVTVYSVLVQATSAGFQILSNKGGCNATAEKSWGCRTSTKELGQSIGSYAYFVSSNPATWVSPGVTISGYTVDVSYSNGDAYITASLSTKTVAATGSWSDSSNKFSTRPSSVTFNAYLGSSTTSSGSCTANSSNSWKCNITGLYSSQTYTIKGSAATGYTSNTPSVEVSATSATVTYTMSTKTVAVTDSFSDQNNKFSTRPSGNVTLTAYLGTTSVGSCAAAVGASCNITGLASSKAYTIKGSAVTGYTSNEPSVAASATSATVTYTMSTKTVSVTDSFSDQNNKFSTRPSGNVTLTAYLGTTSVGSCAAAVGSSCNITSLASSKAYTIKGSAVTGYTSNEPSVAASATSATVTYTMSTKTVTVTDSFSDQNNKFSTRPSGNVTLTAYLDSTSVGSCSAAVGSSCNITSLASSKAYTIRGSTITGYTSDEPSVAASATTAAVTYTLSTKNINVTAAWDDNNNVSLRPDSVTFDAYIGDASESIGDCTTTASVAWQCDISGLAKVNAAGNAISYTIRERSVPSTYTSDYAVVSTENGITAVITNSLSSIDIQVRKIWNDSDNLDGYRPSSVCIRLFDGGNYTDYQVSLTGSGNTWTHTFSSVPASENYTVVETDVCPTPTPTP